MQSLIGSSRCRLMESRSTAALLATCVLTLRLAVSARAAEPEPPADSVRITLPAVEVTALRGHDLVRQIPAATFVLSHDALARTGAGRVSTALSHLPGFYGYRQTGSGEVSVIDPRGFTANGESSYLKLLVNGQDVRDVENGNVDWDWLPADDVERVEVVQGSGAWVYGDGSEGGIVNIVQPAAPVGLRSDCAARVGSYGLRTGSLALAGGRGAWNGSLRGSLRQADGWRDRSTEDAYTGGAELGWRASDRMRAGLDFSVIDTRNEDPGSLTRDQLIADRKQSETDTDYAHSRRLMAGAHLSYAPSPSQEWRLAPYLRGENSDQVSTIFFVPESHPTVGLTGGTELTWRGSLAAGRCTVNAGAQFEHSRLSSDYESTADGSRETHTVGRRTTGSGFASASVALGPAASLRFGVRGDAIRVGPVDRLGLPRITGRTLSQASPFVAVSRVAGRGGMVYGSFSTGFRVPTLHQLFDARPFFNPFTQQVIYISNADLEPQRSLGLELGGRWDRADGSWLLLSAYSVRVRDEIDFDLSRFSYQNLGRSWHRGVELGASQQLERRFALIVNGAWTPTTIVGGENDGRQINAVPQGTAYGALSFAPEPRASVEAGARYTGRQWLDKANQHALPDFATGELAATVRFARLRSTLRVANLFDRKYADSGFIGAVGEERFLPAAGRTFSLALSLD